jgi:hypothetical protein
MGRRKSVDFRRSQKTVEILESESGTYVGRPLTQKGGRLPFAAPPRSAAPADPQPAADAAADPSAPPRSAFCGRLNDNGAGMSLVGIRAQQRGRSIGLATRNHSRREFF